MKKRQPRIVFSFATTAAAIHMEKCCKAAGLPGRLIPVPTAITAGCGLAWSMPPEEKEAVLEKMEEEGLKAEGIYEMEL